MIIFRLCTIIGTYLNINFPYSELILKSLKYFVEQDFTNYFNLSKYSALLEDCHKLGFRHSQVVTWNSGGSETGPGLLRTNPTIYIETTPLHRAMRDWHPQIVQYRWTPQKTSQPPIWIQKILVNNRLPLTLFADIW